MSKITKSSHQSKLLKLRTVNWKLVLLLLAAGWITFLGLTHWQLYHQLKQHRLSKAAHTAAVIKPAASLTNILTWQQIPAIEVWSQLLTELILVDELSQELQTSVTNIYSEQPLFTDKLLALIQQLGDNSQLLKASLDQSRLAKTILADNLFESIQTLLGSISKTAPLLSNAVDHQIRLVVLLQNDDELRATGGFLGSLALIEIKNRQLAPIHFFDIYDLAGQVKQPLPAPYGVQQYLSAGSGMNLPDANWHPDFASSCQNILQLLAQTDIFPPSDQMEDQQMNTETEPITILAAINLTFIENLIALTGPITLVDSDQQITSDNFAQLARQNRAEFFPGDKQKKQFLNQAFNQLQLKLTQLNQSQQVAVLQHIQKGLANRQIQLYSPQDRWQSIFIEQNWAGQLPSDYQQFIVYPVESNVGINKANQKIEREVNLNFINTPSSSEIATANLSLEYHNLNQPLSASEIAVIHNNPHLLQADHLGYVNYQRIITDPQINVENIICGQKQVAPEEENDILSSRQNQFKQTGFLITVPEQQSVSCQITLTGPAETDRWHLIKQPGTR